MDYREEVQELAHKILNLENLIARISFQNRAWADELRQRAAKHRNKIEELILANDVY